MAGLDRGWCVVVDADGEVVEGRDWSVQVVGEHLRARRDGDAGVAGEGQGAVGGGVDGRVGGRDWAGYVDRSEVERGDAECVGDVDAEG